eukprot:256200-Chlamydomonas_euryale.AAC.1
MSTRCVWTRVYGHVQRCPVGHVQIMRRDVHGHVHRHLWTTGDFPEWQWSDRGCAMLAMERSRVYGAVKTQLVESRDMVYSGSIA